jgi:isopenicillin-N epimerase
VSFHEVRFRLFPLGRVMPSALETLGSPPPLGAAMRPLWAIEDGLRFINHGAFGALPRVIAAQQAAWRERMERNTARFFMTELPDALREAAAGLAGFVGTAPDRLGFVTNATAGVNAVVRSLPFAPGDEILTTDHAYNAVRNALLYVASRNGGSVIAAPVGIPVVDAQQILGAITNSITPRTRLVVVDHVASASALEFPVAAIAALCRDRGIPLLVDGAHAPALLDLNVDAIGADWYVGNCHKWLNAPKGAGFLAVSDRPTLPVHPLAISHAYGQGFTAEFDKIGTHDPSAALAVPAAIGFHHWLGGAAMRARNRRLAHDIATALAAEWGTELAGGLDLCHAMVSIRLPGAIPPTREACAAIQESLWRRHRFEAAITAAVGSLYLRISVHAYNDAADYAGLGAAVLEAIAELPPPDGSS